MQDLQKMEQAMEASAFLRQALKIPLNAKSEVGSDLDRENDRLILQVQKKTSAQDLSGIFNANVFDFKHEPTKNTSGFHSFSIDREALMTAMNTTKTRTVMRIAKNMGHSIDYSQNNAHSIKVNGKDFSVKEVYGLTQGTDFKALPKKLDESLSPDEQQKRNAVQETINNTPRFRSGKLQIVGREFGGLTVTIKHSGPQGQELKTPPMALSELHSKIPSVKNDQPQQNTTVESGHKGAERNIEQSQGNNR